MKAPRKKQVSYSLDYVLQAYRWSFLGCNDTTIASTLKMNHRTFRHWYETKYLFRKAINQGRADRDAKPKETFAEYVVGNLSPEMSKIWRKITFWSEHAKGPNKIAKILERQGKHVRQTMWLHAMMANGFNASYACRLVGVSLKVLELWKKDPDFLELVTEIKWHRNNFFENALVDLVAMRDSSAVVFANRTANRDRGYGESLDVNVSGTVNHVHTFDITKLDLPVSVRRAILDAVKVEQTKLKDAEEQKAIALDKEKSVQAQDLEVLQQDLQSTTPETEEEDNDED